MATYVPKILDCSLSFIAVKKNTLLGGSDFAGFFNLSMVVHEL